MLAQQKRVDEAYLAQDKTNATNLATVADLRDRLRRERLQRSAEAAGGGAVVVAPQVRAGAGADHRAAGGAEDSGRFLAVSDREADEEVDDFDADELNEAYRSCRARLASPLTSGPPTN